jgi:hydrogenase maturation protease
MPRVLVIGYGNPLRGDDGVGYCAAERLRDLLPDPDIEIVAAHQLLPEMMERMASSERVVLIDASVGPTPGEIHARRVEGSPPAAGFTHQLTADAVVAGARSLYGWTGEATLLSIAGKDFSSRMGLSSTVEDALEFVLHRVAAHCKLP